ncbi:unnamed protein product [Adineta steineri]|uniref:Multifunctional fusion protein n=1 Tax=Adineta steineri TaxID=433720 RepID=A0A813MQE0_9BILA|nr:unnamed protein product [Adineta steineri]CAF3675924.1 unnamed protein product [Adineta steineri]
MSESESNQNTSSSANAFMNNNNTTKILADVSQPRRRMVRNCSLLWLDECMDETNDVFQNNLAQLQTITNDVNVFNQRDECIDFLTDVQDIKCFLVVENTITQQIMPLINDIRQLDSVYILSDIKILHEECAKKWQKIKGIHINIDDLHKALQLDIKKCNRDSIAMSFITVNDIESTNNLNQLEPTFMYTQIFKDILLDMEHGEQAIKQFIAYCKNNNSISSNNIDIFEKDYHAHSAIWWYTFPSNIYSMLNYGLRTMDADIIITMGFFICHLHQEIQQLYEQQLSNYRKETFTVYRGQGLMKSDFEKLQKTKDGLISFNNFLSTSKDKDVSLDFAVCASTELNKVGILFVMFIDPCIKSAPFASITELSYFEAQEEEILFSMHTVFRVGTIKKIENNNQLYEVELQLTSDHDQELRLLTDRIREEAGSGNGWQRLGSLLLKIGQYNKAEELYNVLLQQTSDENDKALYYSQLGAVKRAQGDYKKAIWYFEQGLEIWEKTIPSNHPLLATSYNNMSGVYYDIGEHSKALSFYEKALGIFEKTLPSNHPALATTYNNIGLVYNSIGEYSKALSYYEKALEIRQRTLPSNHPDLATSYRSIGLLYNNMGEYSKALSFYEKALEIQQKTLSSNHSHLAASYNNIGNVYKNVKSYPKALSYYERALNIWQRALPPTHPHIKSLKNNIEILKKNL